MSRSSESCCYALPTRVALLQAHSTQGGKPTISDLAPAVWYVIKRTSRCSVSLSSRTRTSDATACETRPRPSPRHTYIQNKKHVWMRVSRRGVLWFTPTLATKPRIGGTRRRTPPGSHLTRRAARHERRRWRGALACKQHQQLQLEDCC